MTNFFDRNPILSRGGEFVEFEGDSSEIIVTEALSFVRRQAEVQRPFFAVIWYGTPHSPWTASEPDKTAFTRLDTKSQNHYGELVAMDRSIGTLRDGLRTLGIAEETLVWFTSDNGGSREGQDDGTSQYFRTLLVQTRESGMEDLAVDHSRLDLMGGPQTLPHYPLGWAMVSNTPLRMYKINTHQGGHQVPFIVHWPAGLDGGGEIRSQYQHITDLLPTLAEMTGVEVPTAKNGAALPEPAGASFAHSLADAAVESTHPEQYYEMSGNRGFYRDGWSAVTLRQARTPFSKEEWELHHLAEDPSESRDLAGEHPEKLAELVDAWEEAAWANQVFPLDEGNFVKMVQKPTSDEEFVADVRLRPGMPTLERWRALQLTYARDFDVVVDLDYADGDGGMLFAHGDQGGGYAMYIEHGRLWFAFNGYGDMIVIDGGDVAAGTCQVALSMENAGSFRWNARIRIGDESVGEALDLPVLMAMAPFEGIDVGIDRRSPVSWAVYERHGPFPYTGVLGAVTYRPGELADDAGARFLDYMKQAGTRYE